MAIDPFAVDPTAQPSMLGLGSLGQSAPATDSAKLYQSALQSARQTMASAPQPDPSGITVGGLDALASPAARAPAAKPPTDGPAPIDYAARRRALDEQERADIEATHIALNRNTNAAQDLGTRFVQGAARLPGAVTGVIDAVNPLTYATGHALASEGAEWLGKQTGFRPRQYADSLNDKLSPGALQAKAEIDQAWKDGSTDNLGGSAADIAGAYLRHPVQGIGGLVAESIPLTLAGGALGRAAAVGGKALQAGAGLGAKAGEQMVKFAPAIGEGAIAGGATNAALLEQGVDPRLAGAVALGAGVTTGAIGHQGRLLAQKLGYVDLDASMAGVAQQGARNPGWKERIAGGAAIEGFAEELPQSVTEQMWSNVATGDPLMAGTARAGVEGALAGLAMGGVMNIRPTTRAALDDPATPDVIRAQAMAEIEAELRASDPQLADTWREAAVRALAEGKSAQQILAELQADPDAQSTSIPPAPGPGAPPQAQAPTQPQGPLTQAADLAPPAQQPQAPTPGGTPEPVPADAVANTGAQAWAANVPPVSAPQPGAQRDESGVPGAELSPEPVSAGLTETTGPFTPTHVTDAGVPVQKLEPGVFVDEQGQAHDEMDGVREIPGATQQATQEQDQAAPTDRARSTADEIESIFGSIATGATEAAHEQAVDRLKRDGELTYRHPEAKAAARQNPRYNTIDNPDGSLSVIGLLDPRTGDWVGAPPTTNVNETQPQTDSPTAPTPASTQESQPNEEATNAAQKPGPQGQAGRADGAAPNLTETGADFPASGTAPADARGQAGRAADPGTAVSGVDDAQAQGGLNAGPETSTPTSPQADPSAQPTPTTPAGQAEPGTGAVGAGGDGVAPPRQSITGGLLTDAEEIVVLDALKPARNPAGYLSQRFAGDPRRERLYSDGHVKNLIAEAKGQTNAPTQSPETSDQPADGDVTGAVESASGTSDSPTPAAQPMGRESVPVAAGAEEVAPEPKSTESRLTDRYADLFADAHGADRAISREMAADRASELERAIRDKDAYALGVSGRNLVDAKAAPVARKIFEEETGIKLPARKAAAWRALREWAGITEEQDQVREARRSVERERVLLKQRRNLANADDVLSWADDRLAEGFDRLTSQGRKWYLHNADGQGFNLSVRGTHLNLVRPYLQAMIALRQAESAAKSLPSADLAAAQQDQPPAPTGTTATPRAQRRAEQNAAKESGKPPAEAAPTTPSPEQGQAGAAQREPWEMTREEYGVPPEPQDTAVQVFKNLDRIARDNPERLTEADKRLLAKTKEQRKQHAKYLRDHKLYLPKANAHFIAVRDAISAGRPVPPSVLADYPELAAKAGVERQTKPADAPEGADVGEVRSKLEAIKAKKYKTAQEERLIPIYEARINADPSRFPPGTGVSWKVTQNQTNRGFRVVSVDAANKKATIRSVADTGLTTSGGNQDKITDTVVWLGDLRRDKKYDRTEKAEQPSSNDATETLKQDSAESPHQSAYDILLGVIDGKVAANSQAAETASDRIDIALGGKNSELARQLRQRDWSATGAKANENRKLLNGIADLLGLRVNKTKPADAPQSDGNPYLFSLGERLPGTIEVDGIQRPTTNSEGKPIHPTEDGVRNFWRWFGGSLTVDQSGRPIPFYHGTQRDFSTFHAASQARGLLFFTADRARADGYATGEHAGYTGMAAAEDRASIAVTAEDYPHLFDGIRLNGNGTAAEIADAIFDADFRDTDAISEELRDGKITIKQAVSEFNGMVDELSSGGNTMPVYLRAERPQGSPIKPVQWIDAEAIGGDNLRAKNRDSIYVTEGDGVALAVLDSTQVKSAIGNTGAFDATNPDIRFTLGASAPTRPTTQLSASFIQAKLDPIIRALKGLKIPVRVVPNERALTDTERANLREARKSKPNLYPKAIYRGDEIVIIASNVASAKDALTQLNHEGAHYALRQVFGPSYESFLDELIADRNADVQLYANARGLNMETLKGRREAADELLAHMAERNDPADLPFLTRVYQAIRAALRAMGFRIRMSDSDIREVLAASRKYLETGKAKGALKARGRFGRKATGRNQDARFMFAGRKAETADTMALETAQARIEAGEDAETVRQETGWHKGADGRWRFEISDDQAKLKKPFPSKGQRWGDVHASAFKSKIDGQSGLGITVGEVLDHPALFAAYPDVADISLGVQTKDGASYSPATEMGPAQIEIGENTEMYSLASTLLHEIQHGLQRIEDFATGGAPSTIGITLEQERAIKKIMPRIIEQDEQEEKAIKDAYAALFSGDKSTPLSEISKREFELKKRRLGVKAYQKKDGMIDFELGNRLYQLLAGEVEARNTQTRQRMTDAERRATSPETTADVKSADVIVTFNGKEAANAPRPANAPLGDATRGTVQRGVVSEVSGDAGGTNPDIRHGQADTVAQPTTRAAFSQVLTDLLGKESDWRIHLYDTAEQAPADRRQGSSGGGAYGWVETKNGVTHAYFILDRIEAGTELSKFLHEVGAHIGLENILSPTQMQGLYGKIARWAASGDKASIEAQAAQAALKRVASAKTPSADRQAEVIAYFIEEAVVRGINPTAMSRQSELSRWFRVLWAAFKTALRKLGVQNINDLTPQHVVDLAYGAARLELAGRWHGTAANFRRFDNQYLMSGEGAMVYGAGTYTAARQGVGRTYMKQDIERKQEESGDDTAELVGTFDGVDLADAIKRSTDRGEKIALLEVKSALDDLTPDSDTVLSFKGKMSGLVREALDAMESEFLEAEYGTSRYNDLRDAIDWLEVKANRARFTDMRLKTAIEGSLFRTDHNVTADNTMHWDLPLSEQPAGVQKSLRPVMADLLDSQPELAEMSEDPDDLLSLTGEQIYKALVLDAASDGPLSRRMLEAAGIDPYSAEAGYTDGDRLASAFLDSLGIPAMEHFDGVSRSKYRDGRTDILTTNLVTFSDHNVFRVGRAPGGDLKKIRYGEDNPDIRFSLAEAETEHRTVKEELARRLKAMQGPVSTAERTMMNAIGGLSVRMLADVSKAVIPSATKFVDAMQFFQTERNRMADKSAKTAETMTANPYAENVTLMRLMNDSTVDGVDASQDRYVPKVADVAAARVSIRALRNQAARAKRKLQGDVTGLDVDALIQERESALRQARALSKDIRTDERLAPKHKSLNARYKRLPAWAQTMYKKVRDDYIAMSERMGRAIMGRAIKTQMDAETRILDLIAADTALTADQRSGLQDLLAQGFYDLDELNLAVNPKAAVQKALDESPFGAAIKASIHQQLRVGLAAKQQMIARVRAEFEAGRVEGIYFPLQRFGQYYAAFERPGLDADGVETGKMVKGFAMFDSEYQMNLELPDIQAEGWALTKKGYQVETVKDLMGASEGFVADVVSKLNDSGDKKGADLVYQMYLDSLPFLSARKHFIHRKKTLGYSDDLPRTYTRNMAHMANQIARMEAAPEFQSAMKGMEREAKALPEAERAGRFIEEFQKRYEWIQSPTGAKWSSNLTALGFFWHLGVSPAAALVNLSQTAMVALPELGAKYGYGKAAAMLTRTMFETLKARKPGARFKGRRDYETWTGLNADERAALNHWHEIGAIDVTNVQSMMHLAEGGSAEYSPKVVKAMEISGFLFQEAEVVNREATLLAGYRLAKAAGLSETTARAQAAEMNWNSHGDYSSANRSRWMQGNMQKVMFQFKQYPLMMSYFLGRNAWQSFAGADQQTKDEARKRIVGILGMTGLLAGANGMPWLLTAPLFLTANVLQALFGDDDDEDWDAETAWRAWLADMGLAGKAIDRGAANALTGIDISSRVKLADLWFREPSRELEGKAMHGYLLEQLAGPVVGGVGANLFRAGQLFEEGNYRRAMETASPKFLKDMQMAGRFWQEGGANNMKGEPITDLSPLEAFMKFNGFSPDRLSAMYDMNNKAKTLEQKLVQRRATLIAAYGMSALNGDAEGVRRAKAKIRDYNAKKPALPIDQAALRRSLRAREKYREKADAGIYLNPKLGFVRDVTKVPL